MLAISNVVMLIGVTIISVPMLNAGVAGQELTVLPFYTMPNSIQYQVFNPAAETLAPI